MFGKLFAGRGAERPEADPHALPVPRRQKNGMYTLRALGDKRLLALTDAVRADDWGAFKAALTPFDLGRDHHVLSELADLSGMQNWIVAAADGDTEYRATAQLIAGARNVIWAWEARTGAYAKNVSREQWRLFRERLEAAEDQLLEAAELRPEWIAPWRRLLTSGRGMSLGPVVNEARRDAALRRDPLDLTTHIQWVSNLQPRWSGEPGQAMAFAREAFARAPQGHRLGCVIAFAHIEEWVESDRGASLKNARVQAELRAAAEHSILHPAYTRFPGWQYDFNLFAMALSLADERQTARRVFRALDGAFTKASWSYFAQPEEQFARRSRA
ncbi:hypothetical protein GA0115240_152367 [Streptomyces sp. DvalAA-14]|uniref:hypothetical protein n=1 Tax=unclassified Streptomyces TaxID=2593676 RepID=UPI00081AF86C|nr:MULTISPECIES: hypothetical protein [unclassified Streptomyces]MYS23420.1 hypothetical protein [Streptomyces sp. SID4948]SCE32909.1 hypothetical protein GA0115240_152367 [Streptomyces sp. DvalAA-14]